MISKQWVINGVLASLLAVWMSMAAGAASQPLKIVATTTNLGLLVSALGGSAVDVYTLIPGGACPGHFDGGPAAAQRIAAADMVITHAGENRFDGLVANLGRNDVRRVATQTPGNWMVPVVHDAAAQEIATVLAAQLPGAAAAIRQREHDYRAVLTTRSAAVRATLAGFNGRPVIGAVHQQAFLEWLGLRVVAVYGRGEDLNARALAHAAKQARRAGALLVVDNLQSGADTGAALARDLGIAHVTLTNFPITGSYLDTLAENARIVREALAGATGGRQ
jgi:zinc transport system substrate-binding protein